jgi:hypothetical protein
MIDSYFRIICDRCGVHFLGTPAHEFPNRILPANSVTISIVEHCPFCVMESHPISHRVQFLCQVVKERDQLKKELEVLRTGISKEVKS